MYVRITISFFLLGSSCRMILHKNLVIQNVILYVHTISLMMAKTIYYFGTHTLLDIFHKHIYTAWRWCVFDAFGVFVIYFLKLIPMSSFGTENKQANDIQQCCWMVYGKCERCITPKHIF